MPDRVEIKPLTIRWDENGSIVASSTTGESGPGYASVLEVFRQHYKTGLEELEVSQTRKTSYDLNRWTLSRTTLIEEEFVLQPDSSPADASVDEAVSNMGSLDMHGSIAKTNIEFKPSSEILARIEERAAKEKKITSEEIKASKARLNSWLKETGRSEDRTD